MEKNKYYVSVGEGEISHRPHDRNGYLEISATEAELSNLRRKFDNMHDAGVDSFFRAHVPFLEYHHDDSNDSYDHNMVEVYQMLHELGNKKTREHIENMGILNEKNI
jgi:hypothetical protein